MILVMNERLEFCSKNTDNFVTSFTMLWIGAKLGRFDSFKRLSGNASGDTRSNKLLTIFPLVHIP